jgi:hypothetical protein
LTEETDSSEASEQAIEVVEQAIVVEQAGNS